MPIHLDNLLSRKWSGDVGDSTPVRTPAVPDSGVTRAQDGMERNCVTTAPARGLSRADVLARAKRAEVPQREQIGPTCGLYALGMVMDAWHAKDPRCAAPLVSDADLGGRGRHYNFDPTTPARILDYAKAAGFTSQGEMFTARHLAQTAVHFGYTASIHEHATLDDLYRVLDAGHPAIIAFDVDHNGNPADFGGKRAHYAVIEGYFDQNGERFLVAKHGWAVQKDHVWRAADLDRSWQALHTTRYYGTPGDGVIPDHPELREPSKLGLPDAGRGRADISASLATKIVEVVPAGTTPVGGDVVVAPD